MAKGLSIAALIIAGISLFIPLIGIFTTWIALAIASAGALMGERTFAVTTGVVALFGYIFMSPMLWMSEAGARLGGESGFGIVSVLLCFAPFIAVGLSAKGYGFVPPETPQKRIIG